MDIIDHSLLYHMSPVEAAKVTAYRKRANLLNSSDWTQVVDSPLSSEVKQAWAIYRQELRDITKQIGFPAEIEWPVAPSR